MFSLFRKKKPQVTPPEADISILLWVSRELEDEIIPVLYRTECKEIDFVNHEYVLHLWKERENAIAGNFDNDEMGAIILRIRSQHAILKATLRK